MNPRFRFAPSPTGGLHIGTARTALFNMFAAKSMGGQLILRIEDTDISRSKKEYEESITEDLKWLGIEWDEFYRQRDRLDDYRNSAEKLLKEEKAYHCFCTPERLGDLKNKQYKEGRHSIYDGCCRKLSSGEIEQKIKAGEKYTIRFIVEKARDINFTDLIRGEITFKSDIIGDFIIMKSDGTPSYNFAVVVDDAEMKITHILRGEDHITNTAKQILLFESLGTSLPEFAHLSMIMGKDGSKLSKRHGSTTITEFREEGYLSGAMSNYLSFLSWAPRDGQEILSIGEIAERFKIEDISKSPAVFDTDKLNWLNGAYIRKTGIKELTGLLIPYILNKGILDKEELKDPQTLIKLNKAVSAFSENIKKLSAFPGYIRGLFADKIENYSQEARDILLLDTSAEVFKELEVKLEHLISELSADKIADTTEELGKELVNSIAEVLRPKKIKGRFLYMPVRAALTGQVHGPELPKIISILGIKNCIQRLEQTLKYLDND
ncbi:glutamate--tRNA ligase [Actinomycetota bacterium]